MPPFNYGAAQQFPFLADNTKYSPVEELLNSLGSRQTTSGLMPMADPLSLLQGLSTIQNELMQDKSSRFGLVNNRMQEALRQAEEDALQRRIEAQNKLIRQQQAAANSSGSYSITQPGSSYSGGLGSFPSLPFTNSGNGVKFPKIRGDNTRSLVFPKVNVKSLTEQHLSKYTKKPKVPASIKKPTKKKSTMRIKDPGYA